MTKTCIACGMPMSKPEDFAAGDAAKDYSRHCAGRMDQCSPTEKSSRPTARSW